MTQKELRKLSRVDMLEMLIDQSEELQQLKSRLEAAEKALRDKEIKIEKVGSIAEASLHLNGVFEAAQAACAQYTENMRILSERQEAVCQQREQESRAQAIRRIAEAEERCAHLEAEAKRRCSRMIAKAVEESNAYLREVGRKVDVLCEKYPEIRDELMNMSLLMKEQESSDE